MTEPSGVSVDTPRVSPAFWWFTSVSALSKLGNTFLALAVPWVLLSDGHSVVVAALSFTAQHAPYVLSPLLGRIIDRYDRRRVFLCTELLQGVVVALIPLGLAHHATGLTLLGLVVVGLGSVISNLTSDYALVPSLVSPELTTAAYSRYGAVTGVARCLGPALAGLVITAFGGTTALLLDAATFVITAAVAQLLPIRRTTRSKGPMVGALGLFWRSRRVPRLTVALAAYNIGTGSLPVLVLLAAQDYWEWPSSRAGVVLAAVAGGSALGAWLAGRIGLRLDLGTRITGWFGCCLLSGLLMLFGLPSTVVPALFLLGVAEGAMTVCTNELRARVIPADEVGRVNSVVRGVAMGVVPLSALLVGLVSSWGPHALWLPVVLGSAVAFAVASRLREGQPREREVAA